MSGSAPIYSTTFDVGRYRCTIDFPPLHEDGDPQRPHLISSRWQPEPGPKWDELTDAEQAQYVAGRNAGAEHVAELIGGGVAVVSPGTEPERAPWPGAAADMPDSPDETDGGVLTAADLMLLAMMISEKIIAGQTPEPGDLYAFGRAVETAVLERVRGKS